MPFLDNISVLKKGSFQERVVEYIKITKLSTHIALQTDALQTDAFKRQRNH